MLVHWRPFALVMFPSRGLRTPQRDVHACAVWADLTAAGCTHFIVGRDMAGSKSSITGEDFYGMYDAQVSMGSPHQCSPPCALQGLALPSVCVGLRPPDAATMSCRDAALSGCGRLWAPLPRDATCCLSTLTCLVADCTNLLHVTALARAARFSCRSLPSSTLPSWACRQCPPWTWCSPRRLAT